MKDYTTAYRKISTREDVFSNYTNSKVIGLGGPYLSHYVGRLRDKGVKNIDIWENNKKIFIEQLKQADNLNINLYYGDILLANIDKSALYDFDFCGNMSTFKEHIIRFKHCKQIITVCLRDAFGRDMYDNIDLYLAYRGEFKASIQWNSSLSGILYSDKHVYGLKKYKDSAAMLMIYTL